MAVDGAEPGLLRLGPRDHFIGRLASHGIRAVPFVWGSPQWVGSGVLAQPPISSDADQQAWRDFLKAAVARYGPGGSYWATDYPEQFPGATPLPIQSWQIWNEPNLKKYFSPGQNVQQSAQKYATLLQISHDAIKSRGSAGPDRARRNARHRGLEGLGCSSTTSTRCPGSRATSTPPPCTPIRARLDGVRTEMRAIPRRDDESRRRGHAAVGHRVRLGIGASRPLLQEQGPHGSTAAALELLQADPEPPHGLERAARLLVPVARSEPLGPPYASLCSICGTAGLLRYNRTAKPAYNTFRGFTAETTPPRGDHHLGPPSGLTKDSTPTFSFTSNEAGSTFQCRFDAQAFFTVPLAVHSGLAARKRRPHLLRQGDRRPRKRERGPVAVRSPSTPSPPRRPRSPPPSPHRRPTTTTPR